MNKTVTVNIGGLVFHIEEAAYHILQDYLNQLKKHLENTQGQEEIIGDIEIRIAELLSEKISDTNQVVVESMVQDVIVVMGQPEQYMDTEEDDAFSAESTHESKQDKKKQKRIFRDPDDQVLGGVCSGLSAYFSIDPLWMRLIFVLALFAGFGTSLPIYILLWIIIPEARTRAEKIQMRGKPVNFDNLKQKFEEEASGLKDSINNIDTRNWTGIRNAIKQILAALGTLFKVIFRVLSKVLGFAFLIAGVALFTSLVVLILSEDKLLAISYFNDFQLLSFSEIAALVSSQPSDWPLVKYGALTLIAIFICGFMIAGVQMLFNFRVKSLAGKGIEWTMIFIAILSMVAISTGVTRTATDFSDRETVSETVFLDSLQSDTLVVTCLPETIFEKSIRDTYYNRNELIKVQDNKIIMGTVYFDVKRTSDATPYLEFNRSARGANGFDARNRTKKIDFEFQQTDNKLAFGPWIEFDKTDKFRDQRLRVILRLPVGKSVTLTTESGRIIHDIRNVESEFDLEMTGKTWHMTQEGLTTKAPRIINNI